jgi:CRP-like cAMP-binding protein
MSNTRGLEHVFILKDVPHAVLELVAASAEEMSVMAGDNIVSQGQSPSSLFVIRSGTVRVAAAAGETPVHFGSGETLGEVPFIDGGPAGLTATALERVDLLVLRAKKLESIFAGNPEAGYLFHKAISMSLAKRMRRVIGMIAFAKEREENK